MSVTVCAAYIVMHYIVKKKKKKPKRWWVTKLYESREKYSGYNLLLDLQFQENSGHFRNFVRMSSQDFELLLNAIGPKINKRDTKFRKAVSNKERLAITLRFLATGDSYTSLQYLFKVSKQLISTIIPEVCQTLIEVLEEYIKIPTTTEEWIKISQSFEQLWNFPHCVGSMDGKHVVLQAPINSGSDFFNYKSNFSIVLFALVDAEYNFTYVDVGCQGRISDGGVFKHCQLSKKLSSNSLNLPPKSTLPERNKEIPYVFLGDEAFALSENIMKPFSGTHRKGSEERIFNYRLSRARRVVENVFGICSSVFRVLRKPMLLEPKKAQLVVMAIVLLHNFLRRNNDSKAIYTPPGSFDSENNGVLVEGSWRHETDQEMTSLISIKNVPRRSTISAKEIRQEFTEYFTTNGRLHWQDDFA